MRTPLPYFPDLGARLRACAGPQDRAIWLRPGSRRQELFAAFPSSALLYLNQAIKKEKEGGILTVPTWRDFWEELPRLLFQPPSAADLEDLPFRGGSMGFLGYEHSPGSSTPGFPGAYMGIYPRFVYIDHSRQTAELVTTHGADPMGAEWEKLFGNVTSFTGRSAPAFRLRSPFAPLTPITQYREHFSRIQAYLQAGDCYQVNYAQAFHAGCEGSSSSAMACLIKESDPAHAAWISLPEGDVMCLSPELFLRVDKGRITSKPIKGTAPRASDTLTDAKWRDELARSSKNLAENLMIVDLLRHDIAQHAETGSVKVEKLFEVESLPHVHHLVSTVTGRLRKDSATVDLIRDAFPGGSITGAPKKRAMQIIAELEPTPRSIYCGSIGYIGSDGDALLNIAIRTLLRIGDDLYAWAGGGIVADSECDQEYQECFDKIGALMSALERMGPQD